MEQVEQRTSDLIDAIINSEEYNQFLKARECLKQDYGKKEQADELRKRNYTLQSEEPPGVFSEQMEAFSLEEKIIRKNPEIDHYLMAEQRMCRMLQDIFKNIVSQVDLDLGFLD